MDAWTALNLKGPLTVSTSGGSSNFELQVTSSTLSTNQVIEQTASQGTDSNNIIKVSTYAPVTGSTDPGNSTDVTVPGQIYINTTTNVAFIYTGLNAGQKVFVSLGNPSFENVIENVIINDSVHLPPSTITIPGSGSYPKAVNIISPSSYGSAGQFLTSAGSNTSPDWTDLFTPVKVNSSTASGILSTSNTGISIYAPTQAASGASHVITSDSSGLPVWSSSGVGGERQPMYLNSSGVLTAGNQLYNKSITFNGSNSNLNVTSENDSFSLSFYAPTSQGTQGQALRANSSGIPVWETVDTTIQSGSDNLVTSGAVASAIANLPTPMQFKGTVGYGGTISYSDLSSATYRISGATYKAIEDGSIPSAYAADPNDTSVETGDTIVCNDSTYWVRIPSGDEEDGTVTQIDVSDGLSSSTGGSITTTGTISIASDYRMWHYTATGIGSSTSGSYTASISLSDMPTGMRPRIVQLYNSSDEQILADVTLSTNTVYITFTSTNGNTNYANIICW